MQKNIIKIEHQHRQHMVGDGFRVSQYIPGYGRAMSNDTSPFLMLDYNAPWVIPPQSSHRPGVGLHPHRGFETVTIVYSGEIEHRDTAGNGGIIGTDEVQWMTAGSGLLHNEFMSERFSRSGGIQHMVQLWVNLPKAHKMTPPKYQALTRESIPSIPFEAGRVRVIAGEVSLLGLDGKRKTVPGIASTFSPVELYDIRFEMAGTLSFSTAENSTAIALVIEGTIRVDGKPVETGKIVHFSRSGNEIIMESDAVAKILFMAGSPLDETIAQYGPFVMNTEEEIEEAFRDFHAGKMGDTRDMLD